MVMSDQRSPDAPEANDTSAAPAPHAASIDDPNQPSPKKLTKEEQLALYEEDLKGNDWGHQPC